MAPSNGKHSRKPHNFAREPLSLPRRLAQANSANRLVRKYRKANPRPELVQNDAVNLDANGHSQRRPVGSNHKLSVAAQRDQNDRAREAITAVPDPVPDTGIPPTDGEGYGYHVDATHLTIAPVHPTQILSSLVSVSTFSPLPPLLSLASPTLTRSVAGASRTTTTAVPTSSLIAVEENHPSSRPIPLEPGSQRGLSTPAITLLAIGSAFVFVGIMILIKACAKPRRRPRPTPSLPIFVPDDDQFETKESPVFGGKERFSPRPGNSGLWAWTQYTTPTTMIAQPPQAAASGKEFDEEVVFGRGVIARSAQARGYTEKNQNQYPFADPAHSRGAPTRALADSSYPAPLQQVQNALTRAAGRLSNASISLYPNSPDNGAAGGPKTSFTADDYPIMDRTKPKTLQRSRSSTLNDRLPKDRPHSKFSRYSQGFAYDGADIMSPTFIAAESFGAPTVAITRADAGRTRIKSSYYAPGSYPRMSALPPSTKSNVDSPKPFGVPSFHKSESRRDRDTQVLVSALGLTSPTTDYMPPSPQPTLYPDDSMSVFDAKRPAKRNQRKPPPNNKRASRVLVGAEQSTLPSASPALDASAALGSLMMMDFNATSKSLATLGDGPGDNPTRADLGSGSSTTLTSQFPSVSSKKNLRSRYDDKPPRVPSPPTLPSLSQMALEHANPDAYAEYHSPTYSLYNLYETDRKSRGYY